MQKWQAGFMRSMIFYAVVFVLVAGLCAAVLWAFHDKTIVLFHRNPVVALCSVAGSLFAIVSCLGGAVSCLNIRRGMLQHIEKMKQLKDPNRNDMTDQKWFG
jgi:hypothetical protein